MLKRAFLMSVAAYQVPLSWIITSITVTVLGTTGAKGSTDTLCALFNLESRHQRSRTQYRWSY